VWVKFPPFSRLLAIRATTTQTQLFTDAQQYKSEMHREDPFRETENVEEEIDAKFKYKIILFCAILRAFSIKVPKVLQRTKGIFSIK
jgi:hypothetical protein